jgi:hypothetical protein
LLGPDIPFFIGTGVKLNAALSAGSVSLEAPEIDVDARIVWSVLVIGPIERTDRGMRPGFEGLGLYSLTAGDGHHLVTNRPTLLVGPAPPGFERRDAQDSQCWPTEGSSPFTKSTSAWPTPGWGAGPFRPGEGGSAQPGLGRGRDRHPQTLEPDVGRYGLEKYSHHGPQGHYCGSFGTAVDDEMADLLVEHEGGGIDDGGVRWHADGMAGHRPDGFLGPSPAARARVRSRSVAMCRSCPTSTDETLALRMVSAASSRERPAGTLTAWPWARYPIGDKGSMIGALMALAHADAPVEARAQRPDV